MDPKVKYYWLLLLIPAAFIYWFVYSRSQNKPIRYLPVFGPKSASRTVDTVFHTIPFFEFTDQDNRLVNTDSVKNSIYVTEYFFTTCKTICPVMNANMARVYKAFKNKPGFLILSHTVDPETDSAGTLKAYATRHGVNDRKWLFLTGSKPDLYRLARKGYLLDANQGKGDDEDFIHTQNFALIDREKRIRGYYDGTDSLEIDRLIKEVNLLFKEYDYKNGMVD